MRFSYWEHNAYKFEDSTIIIGSGIVGLSTAISLKQRQPNQSIIVIDRQFPPKGASTKNAGFICFGSISEILDDLQHMTEDECIDLIRLRWNGSEILKSRIGSIADICGGYELFNKNQFPSDSEIENINYLFKKAIGLESCFIKKDNIHFPKFDEFMVHMPHEGQLNPMEMMLKLRQLCQELDIKLIDGIEIENIKAEQKLIICKNNIKIPFYKCIICTNGFTKNFLPNTETIAVRNLVLVSKKMKPSDWSGVYHFDKGYYYFRKHNDRLLIGGARNQEPTIETTDKFGTNSNIFTHLSEFASKNVLHDMKFEVEYEWSGILGVGKTKMPIIKKLDNDLYLGIRLGGMGVAIGSQLGEELAKMINLDYDN